MSGTTDRDTERTSPTATDARSRGLLAPAEVPHEPGLSVIYRLLDGVLELDELVDAWLVVDDHTLGRQVFRAGRRPVGPGELDVLDAPPGLHTRPQLPAGTLDTSLISILAELAVRLDVARYDAGHDPLTGLFHRRRFDEQLAAATARSSRHGWRFSLVVIDVDGLKRVNDTLGHAAGDELLRELGHRLRTRLRIGDVAARIGGDEFALILPELDAALAPVLLDRVRDNGGEELRFSFGVAECPEEATAPEELLATADHRMLAAKRGDSQ